MLGQPEQPTHLCVRVCACVFIHLSDDVCVIFLEVGGLSQSHVLFSLSLGCKFAACGKRQVYLNFTLHYASLFCSQTPVPPPQRINSEPPVEDASSIMVVTVPTRTDVLLLSLT